MSIYNRRYYIHHTLRGIIKIQAKAKTISLTERQHGELSKIQLKKLKELKTKFHYTIQIQLDL